ncbi:Uncharacterized protein TPAR_06427 [Tolypocladium paradoxum]|uniref:Uncharacterized protein n=1 Tax=Tolypocladium paradoxum TaxID=94208 RepID=A0A2S4KT79_9HYPO|nr:Uncharacterized protein TPAR_06427 [Tolypocladium paradoxum]
MRALPSRVAELLKRFEASKILLIEWETSLLQRLGYPLDLFFLIPDDQLEIAREIGTDLGFYRANEQQLRPAYTSEFSGLGFRYWIDESDVALLNSSFRRRRLVLLPLSWTGITRHELAPLSDTSLPCTVWTVPFPVACAAFLRLAARERRGSLLRTSILGELANVVGYRRFDMSYEGDYMEFPADDQPLSDKEVFEMENAVREIRSWVLRGDDEWMREALIQVVVGQASYDDLPHS